MHKLEKYNFAESYLRNVEVTDEDIENIENLILELMESCHLHQLSVEERNEILRTMQGLLIDKLSDYHRSPITTRRSIRFVFDPANSTWQSIHDLLAKAAEGGKDGPVAQYLVGAKLQLRFPELEIGNESYSTADMQKGRAGDFRVKDTVFHVTVAPGQAVYEKCKKNLEKGLKVYLLVPERLLAGTKQNAELQASGKVSVQSIESFVSQNIDELSQFAKTSLRKEFRRLLELYNKRVNATETNKSMMIEIPSNL